MERLTIGQVAGLARVNIETVRYYERRSLLPKPVRTAAGYRQYAPDIVGRIEFIKRAQAAGFTLDEIAGLLALQAASPHDCEAVERGARAAAARIDQKLGELSGMRAVLERLVQACRTREPLEECPLLEALKPHGAD